MFLYERLLHLVQMNLEFNINVKDKALRHFLHTKSCLLFWRLMSIALDCLFIGRPSAPACSTSFAKFRQAAIVKLLLHLLQCILAGYIVEVGIISPALNKNKNTRLTD